MPIKVSNLAQNKKTLTIPFGDDALTITYRPGAMTMRQELELENPSTSKQAVEAMSEVLLATILEWDLLTDGGEPYPLTKDAIVDLQSGVIMAIMQAIRDDSRPNSPSGNGSSGG